MLIDKINKNLEVSVDINIPNSAANLGYMPLKGHVSIIKSKKYGGQPATAVVTHVMPSNKWQELAKEMSNHYAVRREPAPNPKGNFFISNIDITTAIAILNKYGIGKDMANIINMNYQKWAISNQPTNNPTTVGNPPVQCNIQIAIRDQRNQTSNLKKGEVVFGWTKGQEQNIVYRTYGGKSAIPVTQTDATKISQIVKTRPATVVCSGNVSLVKLTGAELQAAGLDTSSPILQAVLQSNQSNTPVVTPPANTGNPTTQNLDNQNSTEWGNGKMTSSRGYTVNDVRDGSRREMWKNGKNLNDATSYGRRNISSGIQTGIDEATGSGAYNPKDGQYIDTKAKNWMLGASAERHEKRGNRREMKMNDSSDEVRDLAGQINMIIARIQQIDEAAKVNGGLTMQQQERRNAFVQRLGELRKAHEKAQWKYDKRYDRAQKSFRKAEDIIKFRGIKNGKGAVDANGNPVDLTKVNTEMNGQEMEEYAGI